MLAISQLSLPKICQETHSPGQRAHTQRIPCPRIQQWPFRIVHPQSRVVRVLNVLLQRQHLGVAHYVAMARIGGFSLVRPARAVSVTASSETCAHRTR
jgi:hypothetical protein